MEGKGNLHSYRKGGERREGFSLISSGGKNHAMSGKKNHEGHQLGRVYECECGIAEMK
jgi:hypothetical protein